MNIWKLGMGLILLAGLSSSCTTSYKVAPVSEKTDLANEVVYALPRNLLKFEVDIKKTVQTPGKLKDYAEKAGLPPDGYIKEKSDTYEVTDVEMTKIATPDYAHVYGVTVVGDHWTKRLFTMELEEKGLITTGSATAISQAPKYAAAAIKTITAVASGLETFSAASSIANIRNQSADSLQKSMGMVPLDAAKMSQLMDPSKLKELFESLNAGVFAAKEAGDQVAVNKAVELKAIINALEQIKADVISGSLSLDYEALELRIKRLEGYRDAALADFAGKKEEDTYTLSITLDPLVAGSHVLFQVTDEGVKVGSGSTHCSVVGSLLPPEVDGCGDKVLQTYTLDLSNWNEGKSIVDALGQKTVASKDGRGFAYRIPRTMNVHIAGKKEADETVLSRIQWVESMGQFGAIHTLPESTGGFGGKMEVKFHAMTGGMQSYTSEAEAVAADDISAIGDSLKAGLETASDIDRDLIKLQKQKDILTLQKEVKDLKETKE